MERLRSPLPDATSLYETDYLRWTETIAEQLRRQDFDRVDWEAVIEEIEAMGRSERRSLESNAIVVVLHLLKWDYQPMQRSGSWEASILEHRRRIRKALQDSPSLQPFLQASWAEIYQEARKQAAAETGLAIAPFPEVCPYDWTAAIADSPLDGNN